MLVGVKWYLVVLLICLGLITNDVCIFSLAIGIYSLFIQFPCVF